MSASRKATGSISRRSYAYIMALRTIIPPSPSIARCPRDGGKLVQDRGDLLARYDGLVCLTCGTETTYDGRLRPASELQYVPDEVLTAPVVGGSAYSHPKRKPLSAHTARRRAANA